MAEQNNKPIIFLAFANERSDQTRYLRELEQEYRQLKTILEQAEEQGLCQLEIHAAATVESILDTFTKYRNRIAIFHFAGHANGYQLLLESSEGRSVTADAGGLATFLGQQSGLQLVFLNGCSTQQQAQGLLEARVSSVIATSRSINDQVAMDFSRRFYQSLVSGATIRTAYKEAEAAVQTAKGGNTRALSWEKDVDMDRWPWDLHVQEGAEVVTQWNLPEAVNDPLFGLPTLPERDLPESPFRHLHWFEEEHAEVFFGRGYQIRDLYQCITTPRTTPIILLYGQSGVGKSSLLAAGLLPRLKDSFTLHYVRREQAKGLLGNLKEVLTSEGKALPLETGWTTLEKETGQPLVLILDQVEEVFTRLREGESELTEFVAALKTIFANPAARPQGKLILGFRKEWLAELEAQLSEAKLPRSKVFLERLDKRGIMEAIEGPVRSARLREQYRLNIEEMLPEVIADDLLVDLDSAIAPTLQILLTKMWEKAIEQDYEQLRFDRELYERLRREGILLKDFLDQQLKSLQQWRAEVVDSGLALDLLAYHTTALGTSGQHSEEGLQQLYLHQQDVLPPSSRGMAGESRRHSLR